VSSLTYTGTYAGNYNVNFTSAMPSANYAMSSQLTQQYNSTALFGVCSVASNTGMGTPITKSTTQIQIVMAGYGGAFATVGDVSMIFVGG